jgi:hypothetical protein
MAGQAASRTVLFGTVSGPQRPTTSMIQIKAPFACAPNDPAFIPRQSAGLPAQEDRLP